MAGLGQIRREPTGSAGLGGGHPLAPPEDPRGSSVLRLLRFERRWLLRIFEAILPSGMASQVSRGAADVPLGRFLDDFVVHAPLLTVLGLRAALWLVLLAPFLVLRRPRSFLGLERAERVLLLERLRRNDNYVVRELAMFVKMVACLGFCGLAAVQEPLGIYPTDDTPPPWARKAPR
jgi:hypothetical protein